MPNLVVFCGPNQAKRQALSLTVAEELGKFRPTCLISLTNKECPWLWALGEGIRWSDMLKDRNAARTRMRVLRLFQAGTSDGRDLVIDLPNLKPELRHMFIGNVPWNYETKLVVVDGNFVGDDEKSVRLRAVWSAWKPSQCGDVGLAVAA